MPPDPAAAEPHVAVVVLHYGDLDDTLACLESVERLDWERLSTIVVDNGPGPPVGDAVRAAHPAAAVLRSERNLGFAGGNNVGIRHALAERADHVLLLNNDTTVDPGLIRALVAIAEREPDVGAVCPLILYADPSDRVWYAGGRFDPRTGRNRPHVGYRESEATLQFGTSETEYATGAGVLMPRRALERVGLLRDELFLQVEDVDWSLRARRAGLRILVAPAGKMWHRVSAASGGESSPAIAYYQVRNTVEVCERLSPLAGVRGLARRASVLAVHLAHACRARDPVANVRAVIEGFGDQRRGRLGPRRGP